MPTRTLSSSRMSELRLRSRRARRARRPKVPSLTRERRLRDSRISERCGDESKKCGRTSSICESDAVVRQSLLCY